MQQAIDGVRTMVPALLFLCAGVPLAALLDRLGFFDALAVRIARPGRPVPVGALWLLAAGTTVVLNLDTTVVLLTPLYIRLARRSGADPLPVALVPLLLAGLASSVLPVSNLTTLIAVERFDLSVGDVLVHLAPVSVAAVAVGWIAYRRRHAVVLPPAPAGEPDRRALAVGSAVVVGLLVGFVAGPAWGVQPWMVALGADAVLVVVTRWLPWRDVPVGTALGVAAIAAAVAAFVPTGALEGLMGATGPAAVAGTTLLGASAANVVNNLPAVLAGFDATTSMTPAAWAWLAGANTGAPLLPIGALANLLWWRIVRDEGLALDVRGYVRLTAPVVLPALAAGAVVLAAGAALSR